MKKRQMRELIGAAQTVLTTWLNVRREKDPFYILKTHQEELRMREEAGRERIQYAEDKVREECARNWELQELVLRLTFQVEQLEKELAAKAAS